VRGTRESRPINHATNRVSMVRYKNKKYWRQWKGHYLVSVRSHRNTKRTGKAKVRQFQIIPVVNEEILRFQIAMEDAMRVAV
jgi:hypothetical protein